MAAALDAVDVETLRARFDPETMASARIYPDAKDISEFDSYLMPYFAELCRFYRNAAANGQAVLLTIT